MMGLLTASTATGALIFLPLMAHLSASGSWRPVVWLVSLAMLTLLPVAIVLMRESPGEIGLARRGEPPGSSSRDATGPARRASSALDVLGRAMRAPAFWGLFGAFFVCGLSTNGLIGTHLIAFCGDRGIPPVNAAALLSLMGVFDLIGATASGWLTDRYDPRKLLFAYFGLRGASLMALPFMPLDAGSLTLFAVFFGLDWVATVPPVLRLTNARFGEHDAPIVYGWIFCGHQAGAATAAIAAGLMRQTAGDYGPAFMGAGALAVFVAFAMFAWPGGQPAAERA